MKKLLTFFLTALLAFSVGWAAQLTYTFTSQSAGTLQGAPTGVTASFTQNANGYTANQGVQLTSAKNTLTLTIKNFTSSYKLTGITLKYCTNSSKGAGNVTAKLGNTDVATPYSLNSTGGTSLRDAVMDVTETAFNGSDLVLTVTASVNSVYVNKFTITYAANSSTPTCATPTFSPDPEDGPFTSAQNVTISCSNPSDATIYFTTDGTTPTTSSSVYNGAISVTSTKTIKAIAVKNGYNNSEVAEATYEIDTELPFTLVTDASTLQAGDEIIFVSANSASTSAKAMSTTQNSNNRGQTTVTVSGTPPIVRATSNTQILTLEGSSAGWYFKTVNGDNSGYLYTPSGNNNYLRTEAENDLYAKATISITSGVPEIYFVQKGYYLRHNSSSSIFSCYSSNTSQNNVYIYRRVGAPKVATPTFSPEPGTYTSAQTVTISSATQGATIAYTYNGGSVQTGTAPVSLYLNTAGTTVIEAYATLAGYVDSDPVTATYTIDLTPTLTVSPTIVNINDDNSANGRKGSFTVNGTNIGTANVGVTRTNDKFTPHLETTSGSGSATNASTYWYFTPAGSLNGSVEMTYNGHALSATTAVTLANAEGANHVSAVVNVNYLYTGNIYIMGYVNENGWAANNGELMDRDESTGNYSKTLTLLDSGDGHAYISFTKALANGADDWNSIAGYRFGPESNGNWTFNENLVNVPCALDTTGGYWSIKIPAGEWVVSINPNTNKFTLVPHVPAPVFDPAGGRYETAQDVEITCTNVDAHIYYTTDGSTPSANNGTLYTDPITVSAESTTIKAIAIYGNASSSVTTATYTIKPIGADDFILVESDNDITASDEYVLVCTRTSGANEGDHAMSYNFNTTYYSTTQSNFTRDDIVVTLEENATVNVLTLEDAGEGLFYIKDHDGKYLRYINGSTSNAVYRGDKQNTAEYKWSISINNNKEVVILNSGVTRYLLANPSANRYACYENTSTSAFYPKLYRKGVATVPAPQITPAGGTSNKRFESIEVTITAAEGCKIYYTTDGTAPSVNSTEYTGVFVLPYGSAPTTVKAIAVDGEDNVSRVTTVVYYWDRVQVSISPASKEVVGNVDVTITPSPSDATVTYTINGDESQTYNGQFTVQVNEENTPVTVEATAVKGESTATASVTYTYKDGGVNSIAEFLALDNNEERFFKNPVVVLFDYSQNGNQDYIWVKDRTGYMKLFIQPGFDEDTSKPRYNNGDVIPEGFTVKKITYTEHDASFIEGKSEDPSLENFKNPTERALADPEQVKLSELLSNPAKYNDRYLYINKLEITGHGGTNYYVASDENNDNTSEVSGNNVIIYNKFPTWNEKDGTSHTVTIPSADGTYYNVKFIFQKYGSVYEIMPIEFTPWVENKVRLEDLVKIGVKDNPYTISNELVAVKVTWDDNYQKFAIFAKDDEAYANKRYPADGQEEYLIRYETPTFINEVPQKVYDQSNWLEILIPSNITSKQDGLYQNQLATLQERYENKILPGSSVQGTYVDDLNPTIGMTSEIGGVLKDASYDPNIFFTGNFVMENLGENGAVSYNQANDGTYFMMDAKPQEFCMVVWAYYEGSGNYFIAPKPEGAEINGHGFHGSFLADMSLCEDIYGLESAAVNKGTSVASCFKASNDESYGSQQMLYGFKAIVRKNPDYWNAQGGNGAPSRIQPYSEADGNAKEGNPAYKVYPMSVGSTSSGNVTDVNEVNAIKAVVSVRYYNVMGMESEKPFEGINIVVTRYSDGSASTMKVLR